MTDLRVEGAAPPNSTRGLGELPVNANLRRTPLKCSARSNIGVDSASGLTILPMERLTAVSGGTSGGIDSGLSTPIGFGEVPVTNGRPIYVDRVYRNGTEELQSAAKKNHSGEQRHRMER